MRFAELAQAGVSAGWRRKAAEKVARPVASRTPLSPEHVRALLGALFFALALRYVLRTVAEARRRA